MNIKKLIATIITGVSLLAFAGIASANIAGAVAPVNDINLYGSSAQFTFWKSTAATYLTDAGCTGVTTSGITKDSNHALIQGTCNGKVINFRITSKASWDGILAVSGNTTNPNLSSEATPTTETCNSSSCTQTSTTCTGYLRPMIDETSCSGGICTATKCVPVTGGASDVEATSITQTSSGQLNGPAGGGAISRNFTGTGALSKNGSVIDTNSQQALADCQEVIVPFAFWVSSDVNAMGVKDLNQTDIRMIFSGQIVDWSDLFGPSYSKAMNVCFRHAGSGTSATLQLAEMTPAKLYGLGEIVNASNPDGTGTYSYYFNDGTGNEETCVNTLTGAVGYFDADKSVGAGSSYPNIAPVTYNGVTTTNGANLKKMIENGQYDFWTVENLFEAYGNTDMPNLCSFLKNAGNNGIAMPDTWYAYTCQLNYTKGGDGLYMSYAGATCPQ